MIFLCVYTHRGTHVYSLIWTSVESALNLTPEKLQGSCEAEHMAVPYPFGDQAMLCLNLASESEYSCCMSLVLLKLA